MDSKFIYEIPTIIPAKENHHDKWGFSTSLDARFALKLREKKLPSHLEPQFQAEGKSIIKLYGVKGMGGETPDHFLEESALLHGVNVPGNSTDLFLDDDAREVFSEKGDLEEYREMINSQKFPPINYISHNVFSKDHAFCLLALWLNWANFIKYLG